jgi:hypothetical protein
LENSFEDIDSSSVSNFELSRPQEGILPEE